MSKNLALWDSLKVTDPQYTKNFSRGGGFSGTAITAAYVIQRLTETFGICGVGWKLVIDDDKYVPGHTLKDGQTQAVVHVVRGHLEFRLPGDQEWFSTGPQFGQTMLVTENKYGVLTDEEAPKKSATDLLSKLALLLGVGADIHLGEWDSNKYVNSPAAGFQPSSTPAAAPPPPAPAVPSPVPGAAVPPAEPQSAAVSLPEPGRAPNGSKDWLAEQWAEYAANAASSEDLLQKYATARAKVESDPATLKTVCVAVSAAAKSLLSKGSPEWGAIVAALQADKAKVG